MHADPGRAILSMSTFMPWFKRLAFGFTKNGRLGYRQIRKTRKTTVATAASLSDKLGRTLAASTASRLRSEGRRQSRSLRMVVIRALGGADGLANTAPRRSLTMLS